MRVLVSAGEASGDLYASALVRRLRPLLPNAEFYGCAGPRLRAEGVRAVIRAESLNVVGIVEVIHHLPRIYRQFRRLVAAARREPPDLAILTDAPDFHLRLARKLLPLGTPLVYLIAPQVWAWRPGRLAQLRRFAHLLCIFPFEEAFFRSHGVTATYIGHPLTRLLRATRSRQEFLNHHGLPPDRPVVALLPGSRPSEIARHLPILLETAPLLRSRLPCSFLLPTPSGLAHVPPLSTFAEPIARSSIQHIEGETWDALAAADVAVAASGTVTIEAALLGTPLLAYYKVSTWSWWMGRWLVNVPFFSMVNLVAENRVVPELIQMDCHPEALAREALRLLSDGGARAQQKLALAGVARRLATDCDPMDRAAHLLYDMITKESSHASR